MGAPAYSLGETLQAGGPNVTNIQISYGPQGVTTTYSFHTFSLKTGLFGVFGKHGTERLKKASQTATELRRASRLSLKEAEKISTSVARAANAARVRALNEAAPPAMNPATPHEGFVAKNTYDCGNDYLAVVATYMHIRVFDTKDWKSVHTFASGKNEVNRVNCVAATRDGRLVAAGYGDTGLYPGQVRVFDVATGKVVAEFD